MTLRSGVLHVLIAVQMVYLLVLVLLLGLGDFRSQDVLDVRKTHGQCRHAVLGFERASLAEL